MDKENLKRLAARPDFIPGIYHYCDHWCERCPFTARCMNYAMSQEDFRDIAAGDAEGLAYWERMKETFEATVALLQDLAARAGIDLDTVLVAEAIEDDVHRHDREVHDHPLSHAARQYAARVDHWLARTIPLFAPNDPAGPAEAPPAAIGRRSREALEEIRWYRDQIHVKLVRALRSALLHDPPPSSMPGDADGSAKVALLAMDRSIDAWCTLWEHLPGHEDEILPLLVHLEQLRAETERTFPAARAFIRPGFDE